MTKDGIFDCAVIGAGITGLSAAYFLSKSSDKIALIDGAADRGLIKTVSKDGFTLECGPNVIALKPDISELINILGLNDRVTYPAIQNFKQMVWFKDAACTVPKSPPAFFKSRLFSFTEKFSIIKSLFSKHASKFKEEDISVAEFFTEIIGKDAVEHVLDPVLLGIFGGDVNKLEARCIFPELFRKIYDNQTIVSILKSGGGRPKIAVLKGGMQSLSDKLASETEGKIADYKSNIRSLNYDGNYSLTLNSGEIIKSKSVIICTSGKNTSEYSGTLAPGISEQLSKVNYASLAVVHAEVEKLPENFHESFGVLFPSKLNIPLLGVMFNSRLFPHLSPQGLDSITICLGGVRHPDFILKTESEISEYAQKTVNEKLKIQCSKILNVCKWKNAIPQYNKGHSNLNAAMEELESQFPGLYFAGADKGGIGVPDRVKIARQKVDLLLSSNIINV